VSILPTSVNWLVSTNRYGWYGA